jgi:hypothetical protein
MANVTRKSSKSSVATVCPSRIGPPCPTRFSFLVKTSCRNLRKALESLSRYRATLLDVMTNASLLRASEDVGNYLGDLAKMEIQVQSESIILRRMVQGQVSGLSGTEILSGCVDVATEGVIEASCHGVRGSSDRIDSALSVSRTIAKGGTYGEFIRTARWSTDEGFLDDSTRMSTDLMQLANALLTVVSGDASLLQDR